MTFAETADRYAPKPEIIGPYSDWPRHLRRSRRSGIHRAVAVSVVLAGVLFHCGVPLLV